MIAVVGNQQGAGCQCARLAVEYGRVKMIRIRFRKEDRANTSSERSDNRQQSEQKGLKSSRDQRRGEEEKEVS